jgi:VWFA-related protein
VNLNVRFLTAAGKPALGLLPKRSDLAVVESGVEQEVRYFSTVEEPFDLVLVLDFSGSTVDKRSLIKKAAQRFIASTRATDRVGVVAFANEIQMVSMLTTDKAAVSEKIKDIKITGASPIWESLKFTYSSVLEKNAAGRRSAVVLMTDGLDNSRQATFSDVMELVRHNDTTFFSIYVDTGERSSGTDLYSRYIRKGQKSLEMLADESGGQFYKADSIGDLNGIYDQVINDLATVYSLGYEPKNEGRDGGWRTVSVKLKTDPNLVAKTRRGYYAN